MADRPRIYFAGPEVFLPEAEAFGAEKRRIALDYGLEGLFPLDNALSLDGLTKPEQARRIALANEELMRRAEALIANLTPFRGVSADVGTAYEVGFARALGKPVLGYTNVVTPYARRASDYRTAGTNLPEADRVGIEIEDFDLAENLMLEIAILESGGRLVRNAVAPGEEMTDLAGFRVCLECARRLLVPQVG